MWNFPFGFHGTVKVAKQSHVFGHMAVHNTKCITVHGNERENSKSNTTSKDNAINSSIPVGNCNKYIPNTSILKLISAIMLFSLVFRCFFLHYFAGTLFRLVLCFAWDFISPGTLFRLVLYFAGTLFRLVLYFANWLKKAKYSTARNKESEI